MDDDAHVAVPKLGGISPPPETAIDDLWRLLVRHYDELLRFCRGYSRSGGPIDYQEAEDLLHLTMSKLAQTAAQTAKITPHLGNDDAFLRWTKNFLKGEISNYWDARRTREKYSGIPTPPEHVQEHSTTDVQRNAEFKMDCEFAADELRRQLFRIDPKCRPIARALIERIRQGAVDFERVAEIKEITGENYKHVWTCMSSIREIWRDLMKGFGLL